MNHLTYSKLRGISGKMSLSFIWYLVVTCVTTSASHRKNILMEIDMRGTFYGRPKSTFKILIDPRTKHGDLVFGLLHKLGYVPFIKAAGFLLFSLTSVPCEIVLK